MPSLCLFAEDANSAGLEGGPGKMADNEGGCSTDLEGSKGRGSRKRAAREDAEGEAPCAVRRFPAAPSCSYLQRQDLSFSDLAQAMRQDVEEQERVIELMGELLSKAVSKEEQACREEALAVFEGKEPPPITAEGYVRRITEYGGCSPCCFVVGVVYLQRMKRVCPGLQLSKTNFQRLFLLPVMLASKFLDDRYYSNQQWADVGGMALQELNLLEEAALHLLGFRLFVTREDYDACLEELEAERWKETELEVLEGRGRMGKIPSYGDITDAAVIF